MTGEGRETLYCGFCGKSQFEVAKLISGPNFCICDECVQLCADIMVEEGHGRPGRAGLDFAPGQVSAASAILSHFAEHVRGAYPNGDAAVAIFQEGDTLRMEVKAAGGGSEILERVIEAAR